MHILYFIKHSSIFRHHVHGLDDDVSQHGRRSLRCEIGPDALCRWDQFVDEKLKAVLEHQIGSVTGGNGPFSMAGPFGLGAFPMMGQVMMLLHF